jgi:tripartite-type tricarboxylate transporter receptor subunit TctC
MKSVIAVGAAFLAVIGLSTQASAQAYPNHPIKIVVAFTPGSGVDIVTRAVGDKLSTALGQPVLIENRGGAGGTIAAAAVASSTPDGYTLLAHSSAHTVNPAIYKTLPYNMEDIVPVAALAVLPNVLVIDPAKGIKSVKELVDYAKKNPGKMNYASAGTGSATHMNAEKLRANAGFDAVHVPFKGTPEAMTEIMAGRIDYMFAPLVAALSLIESDKLTALAVGSANRSARLPNLPTTVEAGVPNSDYNFWVALFAPKGMPAAAIDKINSEVAKALATADLKARYVSMGADPWILKPAELAAVIKKELPENAKLAAAAGLKAE